MVLLLEHKPAPEYRLELRDVYTPAQRQQFKAIFNGIVSMLYGMVAVEMQSLAIVESANKAIADGGDFISVWNGYHMLYDTYAPYSPYSTCNS